jgi:hypothetical protein
MKKFYAPHGFRPKNFWPLLSLPLFIAVIFIMLFDKYLLDENDRPYTPTHSAIIIILAGLFSLLIVSYFFSLFKRRVVLRIANGQISCFENAPLYYRKLPLSSLVGFTHFYEYSLAKKVTTSMINTPYHYIIFHFNRPYCAWMIPEKSFNDIKELIDYLRSAGIPEIHFARSMYPNETLYVPIYYFYVPDEEDCGMIMNS